ncbi:MAG: lamin tail domain-containing protein, partial [Bacteroidales bacterium]|nr:lamin tail domain-containing protein [Bacteroidales bacterium]
MMWTSKGNDRLITICLVLMLGTGTPVSSQPVINEFQALNTSSVQDPDYQEFSDWLELYNPGDTGIDISGYFITDDLLIPEKWKFPAGTTIEANGYLVIWADGHNTGLHASFRLSGSGEQVGLFDTEKRVLDTITYGPQWSDISFGRDTSGSNWVYFQESTPGQPNAGEGYSGISGEPLFSSPGGFYNSSLELQLTAADPGAPIRLTMDGSA